MKTSQQTLWQQQQRFFALMALLGSAGFHGVLVILFFAVKMHTMAIPFMHERAPVPFVLKRVEINPSYLKTAQGPSPSAIVAPAEQPAAVISQKELGAEIFSKASASVRPEVDLGAAAAVAAPPVAVENASLPFNEAESAAIEAEIQKLDVGETAMGGLSGAPNSFAPEALAQDGSGSPKGEGFMPGLGGGAVKAPSFSEIAPRLKIPDANLNPKIPEAVILRLPSDVVFDFDSATIRAEAVPLLGQAADWIAKYAVARIQVSGHTDTFGTDLYNQKLSENRARAVEEWLRQKLGTNKYTFEAKGYGKTRPIVSPKGTIAEQQANRRVEIMVQAINP